MSERYDFEIVQDGIVVAAVYSDDKATAIRELAHYVRQYMQDGPITIKGVTPELMQEARVALVGLHSNE